MSFHFSLLNHPKNLSLFRLQSCKPPAMLCGVMNILSIETFSELQSIAAEAFKSQPDAVCGLNYLVRIAGVELHVTVNRELNVSQFKSY